MKLKNATLLSVTSFSATLFSHGAKPIQLLGRPASIKRLTNFLATQRSIISRFYDTRTSNSYCRRYLMDDKVQWVIKCGYSYDRTYRFPNGESNSIFCSLLLAPLEFPCQLHYPSHWHMFQLHLSLLYFHSASIRGFPPSAAINSEAPHEYFSLNLLPCAGLKFVHVLGFVCLFSCDLMCFSEKVFNIVASY